MSATAAIEGAVKPRYYTRFTAGQRISHAILVFSFLGLAASGLPLRFSEAPLSAGFARAVGGFSAILFFHKFCAVVLTIDFLVHVVDIGYRVLSKKQWGLLWGPDSIMPQLQDFRDFFRHVRWFLFLGPKPAFDRFTYWEKLDYWGVFWGMAIIGTSGYAMWFAPLFTRAFSGAWLNVALLVHGIEALLAVCDIFIVHFVNEHLRPHNYPMDITIFTGSHTEEEFRERHPLEYARALESGSLERMAVPEPPAWAVQTSRIMGTVAVLIGVVLIVLTIEAFLS